MSLCAGIIYSKLLKGVAIVAGCSPLQAPHVASALSAPSTPASLALPASQPDANVCFLKETV